MPQGRTSEQVSISMDWMPTLLAAAGAAPDPAYPPDGINLLPIADGGAARSRAETLLALQGQRAARHARRRMKFLKILDNTFLFNVVDDPLERANLKAAAGRYDRLVAKWARVEQDDAARSGRERHGRHHRRVQARSHRRRSGDAEGGQSRSTANTVVSTFRWTFARANSGHYCKLILCRSSAGRRHTSV